MQVNMKNVTAFFVIILHPDFVSMNFFRHTTDFQRAHCGYYVQDIETGREICGFNADQYFIPASLQKIPISAAALHFLGEEHCFHTDLAY